MKEPDYTKFAWIVYLILIIIVGIFGFSIAKASYDFVKIDCGDLHGSGRVLVYIDDQRYVIPVVCA